MKSYNMLQHIYKMLWNAIKCTNMLNHATKCYSILSTAIDTTQKNTNMSCARHVSGWNDWCVSRLGNPDLECQLVNHHPLWFSSMFYEFVANEIHHKTSPYIRCIFYEPSPNGRLKIGVFTLTLIKIATVAIKHGIWNMVIEHIQ